VRSDKMLWFGKKKSPEWKDLSDGQKRLVAGRIAKSVKA